MTIKSVFRPCMAALLLALGTPLSSMAAMHFIRSNATGGATGMDWINAWKDIPASLVRGDVYYIAAGVYGRHAFSDADSGSSVITIRKATTANHGTDAGWSVEYAGQAQWIDATAPSSTTVSSFWWICGGNYVFDGGSGDGTPTNAGPNGQYGFYFQTGARFNASGMISTGGCASPPHDVTISHLEMNGVDATGGGVYGVTFAGGQGCYCIGGISNFSFDHIYMHDIWGMNQFNDAAGTTFDHVWVARNGSSGTYHNEGMVAAGNTNLTVRYTTFEDIKGTGDIVCLSGSCANWNIYGNTFFNTASFNTGANNGVSLTIGDNLPNGKLVGLRFYSNTISDMNGAGALHSGVVITVSGSTGIDVQNNLIYNCKVVYLPQGVNGSHDYNTLLNSTTPSNGQSPSANEIWTASASPDPFVARVRKNFRLAVDTTPWNPLAAIFSADPDGTSRTSSRGAYQFHIVTAPTNLTAIPH